MPVLMQTTFEIFCRNVHMSMASLSMDYSVGIYGPLSYLMCSRFARQFMFARCMKGHAILRITIAITLLILWITSTEVMASRHSLYVGKKG